MYLRALNIDVFILPLEAQTAKSANLIYKRIEKEDGEGKRKSLLN